MSKTKIIIGILVLVLLGGGVYWFVALEKKEKIQLVSSGETAQIQLEIPELTETYQNETHQFTFKYPTGWVVNAFADETVGGDVITVTDVDQTKGAQMIITSFDENISVLTVERIKQDQPDLVMLNPQEVALGDSGKGVAFLDAESSGANRHVWFIARGFLYQMTTPSNTDTLLQNILNSWTFE